MAAPQDVLSPAACQARPHGLRGDAEAERRSAERLARNPAIAGLCRVALVARCALVLARPPRNLPCQRRAWQAWPMQIPAFRRKRRAATRRPRFLPAGVPLSPAALLVTQRKLAWLLPAGILAGRTGSSRVGVLVFRYGVGGVSGDPVEARAPPRAGTMRARDGACDLAESVIYACSGRCRTPHWHWARARSRRSCQIAR